VHGLLAHTHHQHAPARGTTNDTRVRIEARKDADGATIGVLRKDTGDFGEPFENPLDVRIRLLSLS
jgi:hypothetical protein